jgi:hypothetical protein
MTGLDLLTAVGSEGLEWVRFENAGAVLGIEVDDALEMAEQTEA